MMSYQFEKNALTRAAASFFIAQTNQVHIQFMQQNNALDWQIYATLQDKVKRFLQHDLTSLENLARTQQQAFDWREGIAHSDTLAFRIFDFCYNTLSHACDCILDLEINEFTLLFAQLDQLNAEMEQLGANIRPLQAYQEGLLLELDEVLGNCSKPPLADTYFSFITQTDTSFFGMQQ